MYVAKVCIKYMTHILCRYSIISFVLLILASRFEQPVHAATIKTKSTK